MAINETLAPRSNPVDALFEGHTPKAAQKEEDPLGRDAFLTMLVAQMKNQDPLNPLQGTDFTAQLAQYSSLEQQFNTNDLLSEIKSGFSQENEDNLLDYIDKEVVTDTNSLLWQDGHIIGGGYTVDKPQEVVVTIFDQEGNAIRSWHANHKEAGTYQVEWDGLDASGVPLGNNAYDYTISSPGKGPLRSAMSGRVTGLTYEHGTPYLLVGDRLIDHHQVIRVEGLDEKAAKAVSQDDTHQG